MWFIFIFAILWINSGVPVASAATQAYTELDQTDFWSSIRKRVRSQYFTEIMSPSFEGSSAYIPLKDGSKFFPTNAFGFLWVDYEITNGYKLLYFQRGIIAYAPSSPLQSGNLQFIARDPRFGIRKVQLFSLPHFINQYDIYIHPAWSDLSIQAGRKFELGMRTTHIYQFPGSRWKIGGFTEASASFYKPGGKGSDFYGFIAPFSSYRLSSLFATQHWLMLPFRHLRNTPWRELGWDNPTPYVQNGVSIDVSQKIWASLWLNFEIL